VILTTVLLHAASYLLTDLPTVKDELSIDAENVASDVFLNRQIAIVSEDVARYCNRVFPLETVQDTVYPDRDPYPYQVPGGLFPLQLYRWPVAADGPTLPTILDTPSGLVLPFASTTGVNVGMPVCVPDPPGTPQQLILAPGSFVVSILPNVSVTINKPTLDDVPAGSLVAFGTSVHTGDPPSPAKVLTPGLNFVSDLRCGQLTRMNPFINYPMRWDAVTTYVTYQAGFATIPHDLAGAVLRIITGRFKGRGRDPLLKSMDQAQIGSQTWWVGGIPGQHGSFPEEIADVLSRYRVPVVL
jgi:hypothetical protein